MFSDEVSTTLSLSANVFTGSGEVLEIGSLESSDAGTYQCRAANTAGVLNSRSATLTVSQFSGE